VHHFTTKKTKNQPYRLEDGENIYIIMLYPQETFTKLSMLTLTRSDQTARERKVISPGKGRACFLGCEGPVWLSQNTIQGPTKTGGQTAYDLRAGESGSG